MQTATPVLSVKRIVKFDGEGTLKAYCDLAVDECILIKGVRVVEGRNGLFVSMPRQQGKNQKWYDNVVALTKETKVELNRVVLEAYQQTSEDAPY